MNITVILLLRELGRGNDDDDEKEEGEEMTRKLYENETCIQILHLKTNSLKMVNVSNPRLFSISSIAFFSI